MGNVAELTDDNFQTEVLESVEPVLVDFWAPRCNPCLLIAPMIEELASENAGNVKVTKINVDVYQGVASKLGVSSIPTLMIFKDGELVDRFVGAKPKTQLQEALNQAIG